MLEALNFPGQFIGWIMECISTPSFSLIINGGLHYFFKGKRGIRQEDPISPLMFVLVMEYLSRLLKKVGGLRKFKFHQGCKKLGLTHLVFADDLMLFGHGDKQSFSLLIGALKTFEKVSGLIANSEKTVVYFGSMEDSMKQEILGNTGFIVGSFPFRYIGIPLNAKYMRISDFDSIIDKMLARITCWSSRNLSYNARITLINSVLISLHTYWAQCILMPKGVIQRITQLCRAFLWNGSAVLGGAPPIAWDWVCKPKRFGGLGIRDCNRWNKGALGKYVWKIAKKEDSLWAYSPNRSDGWAWRRLCSVKTDLQQGFEAGNWTSRKYKISECYTWLQGAQTKVIWDKWVWNRFNSPKHTFISWLAVQERLKTIDRLSSFGCNLDTRCLLCGAASESHKHLIFYCPYCLKTVTTWLGFSEKHFNLIASWKHCYRQGNDLVQRKIFGATLAACVYYVWFARNHALWEKAVILPRQLCKSIYLEVIRLCSCVTEQQGFWSVFSLILLTVSVSVRALLCVAGSVLVLMSSCGAVILIYEMLRICFCGPGVRPGAVGCCSFLLV
ncbi:uncharacterized protein LOC110728682 [Chenopodium quinoa]|uniref:uncharacterized protein LOC110728682 n=1 Tax=Chenopodium quinoa TaxID=63459 RepID=UPI000B784C12|nr:uncharacterized protein LOC110728682 [Chenopodium quinoa]